MTLCHVGDHRGISLKAADLRALVKASQEQPMMALDIMKRSDHINLQLDLEHSVPAAGARLWGLLL